MSITYLCLFSSLFVFTSNYSFSSNLIRHHSWKPLWSPQSKFSLIPLSLDCTSSGPFLTYLYLLCVISLFTYVSLSLPNQHMQWEQTFQMHHFSFVVSISERSNLMSYFATHMYKLISNLATSEVAIHTPCFNLHGRTHFKSNILWWEILYLLYKWSIESLFQQMLFSTKNSRLKMLHLSM